MHRAVLYGATAIALVTAVAVPVAAQQSSPPITTRGTLVRLVPPQTVVIKTEDDAEKTIVLQNGWTVNVFQPVAVDALADGTPVRVLNGSMHPSTQVVNANLLRVVTPYSRNRNPGRIRFMSSTEIEFDAVPCLLKKSTPLSVQIGAANYVVPGLVAGRYQPAPKEQQNLFFNRVLPLSHRQTDGKVEAEYDLGNDPRTAGADARVTFIEYPAGGPPTTLRLERIEPLSALGR